jgi:hypothetical protein
MYWGYLFILWSRHRHSVYHYYTKILYSTYIVLLDA